jgi:hypothetical protein
VILATLLLGALWPFHVGRIEPVGLSPCHQGDKIVQQSAAFSHLFGQALLHSHSPAGPSILEMLLVAAAPFETMGPTPFPRRA